jgi:hypothetical protein
MHLGYYSVRNMRNRHEERQTAPHGSRVRSRSQGTRSSARVPECDRTGETIRERSGAALRRGCTHDDRDPGLAEQGADDVEAVGPVAVRDHTPGRRARYEYPRASA